MFDLQNLLDAAPVLIPFFLFLAAAINIDISPIDQDYYESYMAYARAEMMLGNYTPMFGDNAEWVSKLPSDKEL